MLEVWSWVIYFKNSSILDEFNPFLCRNEDIDLSQIKSSQHTYRKIIKAEEVDSIPTISDIININL